MKYMNLKIGEIKYKIRIYKFRNTINMNLILINVYVYYVLSTNYSIYLPQTPFFLALWQVIDNTFWRSTEISQY